ncbi:MAG: T9SS type A sorting domain-containing protein [Flavobacteriales bacterium]|nr:T9SS type A sorting domain-containing protein [Flavobacteriales bacterium]
MPILICARTMGLATALYVARTMVAQAPLEPAWVHTWPFGQDGLPLIAPTGKDNHVTVDAVTGLIHCTISDEELLLSPRNELLFSFDAEGNEITPQSPVLLGKAQFQHLYDPPYNRHATFAPQVHDGIVIAAHAYDQGGIWAPYITGGPLSGDRWSMTTDLPQPGPVPFAVAIGDGGALIQAHGRVIGVDPGGWIQWMHRILSEISAIALSDGIAWILTESGEMKRLQMSDGTVLPSIQMAGAAQYLVVRDEHLFQASADFAGNITVIKTDLLGSEVYTTTTNVGAMGELTGLVVDHAGRAWTSFTVQDMENLAVSGKLVGFDPTGDVLDRYTYGASMNGIATDGERLFITGWSNTATSETYLLGVDAALITSMDPEPGMDQARIWPQPARDELNILLPPAATSIILLDGPGRAIRTWSIAAFSERATLDLSSIPQGAYLIRVQHNGRALTLPIIVQR